ncbi:hypothetical protein DHEL01_v212664 [Diaporthe helianthi]|uniref:Uncharacterized protein n=1 Tax=Diaporthe helianthi TaxID=158607 RepID=A0A2P5HFB8_DIAHE|nr:hypothetical protein DHEL01_v212664 [Diaporthe helianthi]
MIYNNQPDMAVQDDLSMLFDKSLTLNSKPPPTPQDEKIIYISQHYNHSAHILAQKQQQQQPQVQPDEHMQRRSSEPPRSDLQDLELLLRNHGVDTSALSLPQVELFRNAADAQKARLIQLWTICPPSSAAENPSLTWSNTTVEQEEMLAQRRYEYHQQQQQQQHQQQALPDETVMSLDGTDTGTTFGSSPTSMQSGDGRWVAHAQHYMEPYMQSGYEQLAKKEYDASAARRGGVLEYKIATDPVYQSTGGMLDYERQQWMENQYGAVVGGGWGDDEEML